MEMDMEFGKLEIEFSTAKTGTLIKMKFVAEPSFLCEVSYRCQCIVGGEKCTFFPVILNGSIDLSRPLLVTRVSDGRIIGFDIPTVEKNKISEFCKEMEKANIDYRRSQPVEYNIHDNTDYGINNGIGEETIKFFMKNELHVDFFVDDAIFYDIRKKLRSAFEPLAQETYIPYGIGTGKTPEYRARLEKEIAERTAPGRAYIPVDQFLPIFREIAVMELTKYVKASRDQAAAIVTEEERYTTHYTPAQAKARDKAYNDLNNEGGDGFVPHTINIREAERAKKDLAMYDAFLKKYAK